MNSKLHAVCDGEDRPIILLLFEGQMSDYNGATLIIDALPKAKVLLGIIAIVAERRNWPKSG